MDKQHPAQLVFLHTKGITPPWIPHQVFLHNRRETTPWIPPGLLLFLGKKAAHFFYRRRSKPPGLPSHTKGTTHTNVFRKQTPLDQANRT
ncbi:hypothetical protein Taro_029306, partial [Colocasia esculenta]|nr:hypothetical protein [Colocasia esculenta]